MAWDARTQVLEDGKLHQLTPLRNGGPITHAEALTALRRDEGFRDYLVSLFAETPFEAYFWETPPVTSSTAGRIFEFVLRDAPPLAHMAPEPEIFFEPFRRAGPDARIAAFSNLGGDAILVAPVRHGPGGDYPHLAAFARTAPMALQHELWREVGRRASTCLDERPLWMSTSGLGVGWLHVRLDSRPKYYTHAPYREWEGGKR